MADKFRTPWGQTVERGPELVKALRSRYTVRYYIQRLNEDETPFTLYGETYPAGDTFRAVDPEGFMQSYEDELETVASGDYDDVLSDIFGFQRIQGSGNARPGCASGRCGSKNLMPKGAANRAPAKKAPAKRTTAKKPAARASARRY